MTVSKHYAENFVLDEKYSTHADEINKLLAPEETKNGEITVEAYVDDCEFHQDYDDNNCDTVDNRITDVFVIDDRFLEVWENGYAYYGGAHGMPEREERLFDLTTGEELSVSDFYTGTEDEFKTLVAQKVKEDYQKDSTKYFAVDADEAYSNAYESTKLDTGYICWYQDHAVYYFYPYDLGPYAAGFIEIELPYDEFLGTSQLKRITNTDISN